MHPIRTFARSFAAIVAITVIAACSSPAATQGPGTPTQGPAGATAGPVATTAGEPTQGPTDGPVAGEPCTFLSSEELGVIMGTTPVEIEERPGRGDCDYWLDAEKTSKVNIGVTTGADAATLFENTKALGETLPVPNLGDDAYMLVLEGLGTLVLALDGDTVVSVQVLTTQDSAEQAIRAINVARAVVENL